MEKEREKNVLEILKEENQRLRKENESMKKEIELNKLDSLVAGELIEKLNKCKMDPDQKDLNGNQMEGASVHLQCNSAQCMRPTNLTSSSFTLKISKELLDFLDSNDCFAYKVN